MKIKSVIASILFADLVNSTKVKDDKLKAIITEKFEYFKANLLNETNHFFYKGLGDGALICSFDHSDLADIALKIRDNIKFTDWLKLGFSQNISVRIGVHLAKINIKQDSDIITDVFGFGVDTAARIEPVAEENSVYISKKFYDFLFEDKPTLYNAIPLGLIALPKNFGSLELYKLDWSNNIEQLEFSYDFNIDNIPHNALLEEIPIPKIKTVFTEEQKNNLIETTFLEIKKYFKVGLNVLKSKVPNVEISFIEGTDNKFACKVFYKDELKCKCKIWLRDKFTAFTAYKSICYSDNYIDIATDNKFTLWVTVDDNTEHIFLNISSMGKFNNREGFLNTNINGKNAAEILWLNFIKPFQNM